MTEYSTDVALSETDAGVVAYCPALAIDVRADDAESALRSLKVRIVQRLREREAFGVMLHDSSQIMQADPEFIVGTLTVRY